MATRPPQSFEATRRRHAERIAEYEAHMQQAASRTRSPSQARSHASDDSQTVVLSHRDAQTSHSPSQKSEEDKEAPVEENLHCWICLADEPVADREVGEWKSPCSCNLTAHEDCLLQWIASQKGPVDRVYCPQCKTEITIAQPHDYIVDFIRTVKSIAEDCVLPVGMIAALGITYSGLLVYGANTTNLIFGRREALKWFGSSGPDRNSRQNLFWNACKDFVVITCPFFPPSNGRRSWNYFLTLPLIAPVLVLSRFEVADKIFTFVPIGYSVFQLIGPGKPSQNFMQWPPSPGLTLAILPTFRTVYTETYKYFFKDLEKKWDQAVQRKPREGETAEEVAQAAAEARDNERHVLEIGLEIGPVGEENEEILLNENQAPQAEDAQRAEELLPQLQAELNAADGQQNALDRNVDALERRLNITGGDGVATSVLGALFFPAISWAMGNIIKKSLPLTWVRAPYIVKGWRKGGGKLSWSEGFLQTQFGRSIAGGCLFIVLKDAVLLYYKWKRAKDFGKRRIMNYNETKRDAPAAAQ